MSAAKRGQASEVRRYVGTAHDLAGERLLFTEEHEESYAGGRPTLSRVVYRDPAGEVFASKTVTYGADPRTPSFELVDLRDGYKEGALLVDDGIELFRRTSAEHELEHRRLPLPASATVDEGSHYLVLERWDELAAGGKVAFDFAVPYKRDFFAFRIVPEPAPPDRLALRLEIASRMLRLLVDPLHLVYDRATRRLLSFSGITAINDETGHSHRARIVFDYP